MDTIQLQLWRCEMNQKLELIQKSTQPGFTIDQCLLSQKIIENCFRNVESIENDENVENIENVENVENIELFTKISHKFAEDKMSNMMQELTVPQYQFTV